MTETDPYVKDCPRGHGRMCLECAPTQPDALYCQTCGKRIGDETGYGPRPHMSASLKEQMRNKVRRLLEAGYNKVEISELTGYTFASVCSLLRKMRRAAL